MPMLIVKRILQNLIEFLQTKKENHFYNNSISLCLASEMELKYKFVRYVNINYYFLLFLNNLSE